MSTATTSPSPTKQTRSNSLSTPPTKQTRSNSLSSSSSSSPTKKTRSNSSTSPKTKNKLKSPSGGGSKSQSNNTKSFHSRSTPPIQPRRLLQNTTTTPTKSSTKSTNKNSSSHHHRRQPSHSPVSIRSSSSSLHRSTRTPTATTTQSITSKAHSTSTTRSSHRKSQPPSSIRVSPSVKPTTPPRSPSSSSASSASSPPALHILILTRLQGFETLLRNALRSIPDLPPLHVTSFLRNNTNKHKATATATATATSTEAATTETATATATSTEAATTETATQKLDTLTDAQQRAVSSAQIIFADPDLLRYILPTARSVQWVQCLWAGVDLAIDAIQIRRTFLAAEKERFAALVREREAKMAKVREADRILADANGKVRAMKKRDLTELGNYAKPPPLVKLCLTATCDLLGFGEKLEYDMLKKLLVKENFPRKMTNFDPTTIKQEELDRIENLYFSIPEFTVKHMKNASFVCGILTNWLLSLRTVCKFCQDVGVQELRKELAELRASGGSESSLMSSLGSGGGGAAAGTGAGSESSPAYPPSGTNGTDGGDGSDGGDGNGTTQKPDGEFILTRVGDCFGDAIAEYCLMHILNYNRETHRMKTWQTQMVWSRSSRTQKFRSLKEHVVGIMGGSGNIGLAVGNLLSTVGCRVHGLSKKPNPTLSTEHPDTTWFAAEDGNLAPFLRSGLTVIINCLPATPETKGLLNRELLEEAYGVGAGVGIDSAGGAGAGVDSAGVAGAVTNTCHPPFFINVGRGDVIPSKELVAAIEEGLLVGAALDVVEEEPLPVDDPLWTCRRRRKVIKREGGINYGEEEEGEEEEEKQESGDSIVITPHVAATSASVLPEIVNLCQKNLLAFMDSKPLSFVVDEERGY